MITAKMSPIALALVGAFALTACQTTTDTAGGAETSPLSVGFADSAWDGKTIPDGQQCSRNGGNGATPALIVSDIPAEADTIIVEYNDLSYGPLSRNGGHGIIGYKITPGKSTATLPSVPGWSDDLPAGAFIEANNRGYVKVGYAPPCSGGAGNRYVATVYARDGETVVASSGQFDIGRY